jgi:hypothetical protein
MSLRALLKCKKISSRKIGISLGNVCYSAVWAHKNYYRRSKIDGYNTRVFDDI